MISYLSLLFYIFNVSITGLLYNLDLWRKLRENAAMYKIYTKSGEDIAVFAEAFGLAYKVSAPVKKEAKKPATPKQVCTSTGLKFFMCTLILFRFLSEP